MLNITPKKLFSSYTAEEQQLILQRGESLQLCEQGEERNLEDAFCLAAYLQNKRNVRFKPTVDKVVKEKALTKAQKLEILEQVVVMGDLKPTEKQQQVLDELVGVNKEYFIFTYSNGNKELMKLTKTNIKKKLKELNQDLLDKIMPLTQSEQEFFNTLTGDTNG